MVAIYEMNNLMHTLLTTLPYLPYPHKYLNEIFLPSFLPSFRTITYTYQDYLTAFGTEKLNEWMNKRSRNKQSSQVPKDKTSSWKE